MNSKDLTTLSHIPQTNRALVGFLWGQWVRHTTKLQLLKTTYFPIIVQQFFPERTYVHYFGLLYENKLKLPLSLKICCVFFVLMRHLKNFLRKVSETLHFLNHYVQLETSICVCLSNNYK